MTHCLHIILRILFFPLSLLFIRCGNSSLSSGVVVDPARLRINVIISRSTGDEGNTNESILAYIKDNKDQTVANQQILIKVNGKALRLTNGSSNYYGVYPHYQLTDTSTVINADSTYAITIVLTDGREYKVGKIQPQPDLTSMLFPVPVTHSRQQPLTLRWQAVEPHNWLINHWKSWQGETSATELKISKSNRVHDKWNTVQYERSSTQESDYLSTSIRSGNGSYTIPLSYLRGDTKPFNTVDILVDSEKRQKAASPFLSGSTISSRRTGRYRLALTN
ncbi:hypothetical protein [Spirosoma flavum]|uniref:DUF4249 domain-containing protein n=1 Tax=Spirosoma flavum TaxID=2048557 RepID=A0ABW6AFJ6_9BACT